MERLPTLTFVHHPIVGNPTNVQGVRMWAILDRTHETVEDGFESRDFAVERMIELENEEKIKIGSCYVVELR